MKTISQLSQWCRQCELERAEYEVQVRQNTGTFTSQVFVQYLCTDCLQDKITDYRASTDSDNKILGMRYRALFTGNVWQEIGWSGSPS